MEDAWYSVSVFAHAMLERMSQKDEATIVFYAYFNAGCWLLHPKELSVSLAWL